MFASEQKARFNHLDNWFSSIIGKQIEQAFAQELAKYPHLLHGETLLQLGLCGASPWLDFCHYPYKWLLSAHETHAQSAACISLFDHLPFDNNSIDCVIAPLTIHAYPRMNVVLNEIDRVLRPQKYVIFFCINPWSLWSLWLKFSHFNCFGRLKGYSHSLILLRRILFHHDYVQTYSNSFYYLPPLEDIHCLNKLQFLNQVGKMIAPMPAAFYCLMMQKQTIIPLQPVRSVHPIYQPT